MLHDQALKFVGKRVYVVNDDTSVTYGYLEAVKASSVVVRDIISNKLISAHLRHIYPDKRI
jgi:hypothetical protein